MLYIDENKIQALLNTKPEPEQVKKILKKSRSLQRLTLEETAQLLNVQDQALLQEIFETAKAVKDQIYGKRIVLFAPLYISNICQNSCLYCAFRSENAQLQRKALTPAEITEQTKYLLGRGHKRILLVAGEAPPKGIKLIDYYVASIRAIYAARVGKNNIRRVNINCAPLSVADFKKLKAEGIGTYQIFQETYHQETYKYVHPRGPKSDPDNRISAVDRAFAAGIDDVGIGVLYGLYDYRFETLAMLQHIEALEKKHSVGPHTISVPRIEPAQGSDLSINIPHRVSDQDFKKVVAVLRLAVPYTGIILSTRETAEMRDQLLDLGISQMSAESNTAAGGYSAEETPGQFITADHRKLDEVIDSLMDHGYIPSFCTGCYRKGRTGEAFMDLAKPGLIKGKCYFNALLTMKEYLDDFAPQKIQKKGYNYLEKLKADVPQAERQILDNLFAEITAGKRDNYV